MRALGLWAGLGALLALAALAQAAPPLEQPWRIDTAGPGVAAGPVAGFGFDAAGQKAFIATADRAGLGTSDNDVVYLLFDQGNATPEADPDELRGEGRSTAALSGDGNAAVVGGNYTGGTLEDSQNIYYFRLPDLEPTWRASRPEPITTSAISHDGRVVVLGARNGTQGSGKVFRFNGENGQQVWQAVVDRCGATTGSAGSVLSLDVSRDGRYIAVGTSFLANDGPRGCVLVFDSASLNPVLCYLSPDVGSGDVTAVDISANGAWVVAGTSGGRFFLLRNAPGSQGCPLNAVPLQERLVALAPVVAVRVQEDGAAVVVGDAGSVSRYTQVPGALVLNWSAPLPGLRSLDTTPDGEYIVVGGGVLTAFHRSGNATLWGVDFQGAMVKVARPGPSDLRILAASGTTVRGFRLHWGVELRKTEPEPLALSLGQTRSTNLEVVNTGSGVDTFALSASAPGFALNLDPLQLPLRPGEALNTTMTLTPNPAAEARLYRVELQARGLGSGATSTALLNATVGALPQLALRLENPADAERAVFQGDELNLVLQVQNGGNNRLDIAFDLVQDPNVGDAWDASLARTSAIVDAGGITTNTLTVRVPLEARNGTENFLNLTARGEGVQASTSVHLVVNPIFTAAVDVVPQSKIVAPGKSATYTVVVANNGTLREQYRLVYCVALPDLIPCLGNATQGLGGWSVALDTGPFFLEHDASRSFQLTIAAPRGALPGEDRLALQVEVISANPDHRLRDTELVLTAVEAENPPPPRDVIPGFDALLLGLAGAGAAVLARRRR